MDLLINIRHVYYISVSVSFTRVALWSVSMVYLFNHKLCIRMEYIYVSHWLVFMSDGKTECECGTDPMQGLSRDTGEYQSAKPVRKMFISSW